MNLPTDISIMASSLFIFSTVAVILTLHLIMKRGQLPVSKKTAMYVTIFLVMWAALQLVLSKAGVYRDDMNLLPPKIILLGVLPLIVVMLYAFNTKKGKVFIDSLPLAGLTAIHFVRVFVELGLYYLFLGHAIPEIMTFTGQNFDILAGLTAPVLIYFVFYVKKWRYRVLLVWNLACLFLLLYIVALAFLSSPSPIQQISFSQPNIAMFYFPFSWLPTVIVPIILFSHLVAIRQLMFQHFYLNTMAHG